ncbi:MAG: hypothetical protein ABWY25_03530 [Paenisporosarcina sp.]
MAFLFVAKFTYCIMKTKDRGENNEEVQEVYGFARNRQSGA